jgi:hypothetical protein
MAGWIMSEWKDRLTAWGHLSLLIKTQLECHIIFHWWLLKQHLQQYLLLSSK